MLYNLMRCASVTLPDIFFHCQYPKNQVRRSFAWAQNALKQVRIGAKHTQYPCMCFQYEFKKQFLTWNIYTYQLSIWFFNLNIFLNLIPLNFQKPIFTFKFQYWQIQNKNIQGLIVSNVCSSYCSSQTHRQRRFTLLCGLFIWDSVIDNKLFLFHLSLFFFTQT